MHEAFLGVRFVRSAERCGNYVPSIIYHLNMLHNKVKEVNNHENIVSYLNMFMVCPREKTPPN